MAVNYLEDYLGIDPSDYSAMEQGIAGISPLSPEQSILPQAPVMPRASIMDEGDFASATAPLMGRVYSREQAAREKSTALANELQALQKEMAQTSETEIQKRADLERQIQNIMQERDVSRTSAEDLANQLQGLENNLQEVTQLRDIAVQDYQDSVAQQDIIRQEAAENQARQLEEQRNALLEEREGIVSTLEQDFGVQRSELESLIGNLEGKVGELESVRGSLEGQINDLSSQMQNLEVEKQDALAQQDIIRAESAQAQQDALAQQAEEFTGERSALEQQIADLQAQVGQQQPPADMPPPQDVLLDARRKELENIGYDAADVEEILERDQQRGLENVTSNVLPDLIGKTPPVIPPRPPQLPPKRSDQLFIDDRPRDPRLDRERGVPIGGNVPGGGGIDYGGPQQSIPLIPKREILQKPIIPPRRDDFMSIERIEEPRDEFIPRMPNEDMVPFVPQPQAPVNPMLPPRKELSGPILGGGLKNPMGRMMMRANGGTISQAIADLQNRLR